MTSLILVQADNLSSLKIIFNVQRLIIEFKINILCNGCNLHNTYCTGERYPLAHFFKIKFNDDIRQYCIQIIY